MARRIIALFLMLCMPVGLVACGHAPADGTTVTTDTQATTANTTVPTTEPETQPTTEPTTEPTEPSLEEVDFSTLWTLICENYINLQSSPGGATIGSIPVGATLTLQKWYEKYALVTYEGKQGYVSANYIKPADESYFAKRLRVVSPTCKYTYEQMLSDMEALQMMYPKLIRLGIIGKSEDGRDIPVMILGNPDAPKHILMQGAMHAREHFTAWLLMAIADNSLLMNYLADESVCYHIIPMSNPDGVVLSQTQTLNSVQEEIYKRDLSYGYTTYGKEYYAQQWKSNGLGVDLNRNFPSGWEGSLEHPKPSSSHYRGESPLCAAESKALADYTLSRSFAATFSFHSSGSVLYYRYGNKQPVNDLSYQLALAVQKNTGYTPIGGSDGTSGAGYKDWAMDALGIPSLTVEIGSYTTPLEQRDIYNTFARFESFLPTLSSWLAQ